MASDNYSTAIVWDDWSNPPPPKKKQIKKKKGRFLLWLRANVSSASSTGLKGCAYRHEVMWCVPLGPAYCCNISWKALVELQNALCSRPEEQNAKAKLARTMGQTNLVGPLHILLACQHMEDIATNSGSRAPGHQYSKVHGPQVCGTNFVLWDHHIWPIEFKGGNRRYSSRHRWIGRTWHYGNQAGQEFGLHSLCDIYLDPVQKQSWPKIADRIILLPPQIITHLDLLPQALTSFSIRSLHNISG